MKAGNKKMAIDAHNRDHLTGTWRRQAGRTDGQKNTQNRPKPSRTWKSAWRAPSVFARSLFNSKAPGPPAPPKPSFYQPSPEETPESLFRTYYGMAGENKLMESLHTDGGLLCGVLRDKNNKPAFSTYKSINRLIMVWALQDLIDLDPVWAEKKLDESRLEFLNKLSKLGINLCGKIKDLDKDRPKSEQRIDISGQLSNEDLIEVCCDTTLTWLRNYVEANPSLFTDTEVTKYDI